MKIVIIIFNIIINIIVIENNNEKRAFYNWVVWLIKLNKVLFDLMAFQERNGICGMKPEYSEQNLAKKFKTNQDLK